MKIAIVDTSKFHHTYLYSQCQIFFRDEVDFYVSEFLKCSIEKEKIKKNPNFNWIDFKTHTKFFYYKKMLKKINSSNYDYVFFNTLQEDWLLNLYFFLFLNKKVKLNLAIHNINVFCYSPFSKNLRFMATRIIRKIALARADSINVYGENLKKYISQYMHSKKISTLPFSVHKERKIKIKNKKLKIVIPGAFELKRRDYKSIYEAIKKIDDFDFELIILGRQIGDDSKYLFEEFKKMKNVITYDGFIDEIEFNKQMEEADIILGPVNKNIDICGVTEEYGQTKETGATFAAIKYGIPLLIPNDIKKSKEIEMFTLKYKSSEELKVILKDFMLNEKESLNIRTVAKKIPKKYTAEKVRERLSKELELIS